MRGIFAEWMVAELLGLQPDPRGSWNEYDLVLPSGLTIEVKASASGRIRVEMYARRRDSENGSLLSPRRTAPRDLEFAVFAGECGVLPPATDGRGIRRIGMAALLSPENQQ